MHSVTRSTAVILLVCAWCCWAAVLPNVKPPRHFAPHHGDPHFMSRRDFHPRWQPREHHRHHRAEDIPSFEGRRFVEKSVKEDRALAKPNADEDIAESGSDSTIESAVKEKNSRQVTEAPVHRLKEDEIPDMSNRPKPAPIERKRDASSFPIHFMADADGSMAVSRPQVHTINGVDINQESFRKIHPILRPARPSDIIIHNKGSDEPKTWINLRISIDENGILNVEAGPQPQREAAAASAVPASAEASDISAASAIMQPNVQWSRGRPVNVQLAQRTQPEHTYQAPAWSHPHTYKWNGHHKRHFVHGHERDFLLPRAPPHFMRRKNQKSIMGPSYPPVYPGKGDHRLHQQRAQSEQSEQEHLHKKLNKKVRPEPVNIEQRREPEKGSLPNEQETHDVAESNEKPVKWELENKIAQPATSLQAASAQIELGPIELPPVPDVKPHQEKPFEKHEQVKQSAVDKIETDEFEGCPALNCKMTCPNNLFKLNMVTGCKMCECCPAVQCAMHCEKGFKSDDYGCPMCQCLE